MTDRKRSRTSILSGEKPAMPEELVDPKARELLGALNATYKFSGETEVKKAADEADPDTFETLRNYLTLVDTYLDRESEELQTAYLSVQDHIHGDFYGLMLKMNYDKLSDEELEEHQKNTEFLLQSIKFNRLRLKLSAKFPHDIFD